MMEQVTLLQQELEDQKKTQHGIAQQISNLTLNMQILLKDKMEEQEEVFGITFNSTPPGGSRGTADLGRLQIRSVKLDFPKFDRADPNGWLYKATLFFNFHKIAVNNRIQLASYHMGGQVLIWFQDLENSSCLYTWEGFVQALIIKFRTSSYDNPMEILTRLRQNDSVKAYKGQFETLSNRLGSLSENYKLSCFLSGLKDEIKLPVRMFNPPNLITAYGLAKI